MGCIDDEYLLEKIKNNQPKDLTDENDELGTHDKGDLIKDFLNIIVKHDPLDMKIIALYGEWGSGKTSLLKYIKKQLDDDTFKTVFFDTWQMENDDNLPMTLFETIFDKNKSTCEKIKKETWESAKAIMSGLVDATTINVPHVGRISLEKVRMSVNDYLEKGSFADKIDDFKIKYRELESDILKENEYLVVFIDDLDRCEPENILNLLSAIKLFFALGKRTIFVCAVDKTAVNKALQCKYNDVIKSEEYLEKLFDISFDMPIVELDKMIDSFIGFDTDIKEIKNFIYAMHFTNPRHVKKIFNKYLLLEYYRGLNIGKPLLIPNQNLLFFKLLTLFIIILYEFEKETFITLKQYDEKLDYWKKNTEGFNNIQGLKALKDKGNGTIKDIYMLSPVIRSRAENGIKQTGRKTSDLFVSILTTLFAPKIDGYIDILMPDYHRQFMTCTVNGKISYAAYFCNYLNNNQAVFRNSEITNLKTIKYTTVKQSLMDCSYRLWDIFAMAELYL